MLYKVLRKNTKSKVLSTIYISKNIPFDFLYFSFKAFMINRNSFYFPKYSFFIYSSYQSYKKARILCKKIFFNLPLHLREKYREILTYYLFYRIPFLLSYIPYLKKELKKYKHFFTHHEVTKTSLLFVNLIKKSYSVQHGHLWKRNSIAMGDFGFFPTKCDKILVWGEVFKSLFRQRGVPEDKIFICGSPFYVSLFKRRKKHKKIKGRILWITQQAKGMEDEGIYIFSKFLEGFKIYKKKNKESFLIIKARERENLRMYKYLLDKFSIKDYKITLSNLWEEIEKAEVVLSSFSTALYEALILGANIIAIFPENRNPPFPYRDFNIPYTHDPEKIAFYIENPPLIKFDKEKLSLFFHNFFNPEDVYVKFENILK